MNKYRYDKAFLKSCITRIVKQYNEHVFPQKVTLKFDEKSDDGKFIRDLFHPYGALISNPCKIVIGMKSIADLNVNKVSDEMFVNTIWQCYHECCHALQYYQKYLSDKPSELDKRMAEISLISAYLEEYYLFGYKNNPIEIEADLHALKNTLAFCDSLNLNMNYKDILLDKINSSVFLTDKSDSIEDGIRLYEKRLIDSYYEKRVPLIEVGLRSIEQIGLENNISKPSERIERKLSKRYKKLRKDQVLYCFVINSDNAEMESMYLCKYIALKEPAYFRSYPYLYQKYCMNSIQFNDMIEYVVRLILNIK